MCSSIWWVYLIAVRQWVIRFAENEEKVRAEREMNVAVRNQLILLKIDP